MSGRVKDHVDHSLSELKDAQARWREGSGEAAVDRLREAFKDALKAVAVSRGLSLRSEVALWNFASALAQTSPRNPRLEEAAEWLGFLEEAVVDNVVGDERWRIAYKRIGEGVREMHRLASEVRRR